MQDHPRPPSVCVVPVLFTGRKKKCLRTISSPGFLSPRPTGGITSALEDEANADT